MTTPIIHIYGKRTIDLLFECISKLNNNPEGKIIIKAYSASINKGIKIAHILKRKIGADILKTTLGSININGVLTPFIEIPLKIRSFGNLSRGKMSAQQWIDDKFGKINFINYSTYHLLLDYYFSKEKSIEIAIRKNDRAVNLLKIFEENGKIKYKFLISEEDNIRDEKEMSKFHRNICSAMYRCGITMPPSWIKIANKLSEKDDVVLGLDTNILTNCTITEHLLPAISLIESAEFINTPNWILLVVPSTVMYELESASNSRDDKNKLTFIGRQAYRALQEIMELGHNIDISGVSLLITGDTNPILDLHKSIKRVSNNIYTFGTSFARHDFNLHNRDFKGINGFLPPIKSSGEDMMIRNQFKQFLNQINFHKTTYFLTADKTNSALATAEGLGTIYVDTPVQKLEVSEITAIQMGDKENTFNMDPPIGNIIYEMAVNFGSIFVKLNNKGIRLDCDLNGDFLGRWMRKQLRIEKEDLASLLKDYHGPCHLEEAYKLFENISSRFENTEWLTDMENVFNNTDSI